MTIRLHSSVRGTVSSVIPLRQAKELPDLLQEPGFCAAVSSLSPAVGWKSLQLSVLLVDEHI